MLFILIITLSIYSGALMNLSPIFNNMDEVIFLIFTIIVLIKVFVKKQKILLNKYEKISIVCMIIFFILGNISAYRSGIQKDYMYVFLSGVLTVKPLIVYYAIRMCMEDINIKRKELLIYNIGLTIVLWIYCIIALINIKGNFLQEFGIRNGINTISIGFTHPSTLEFFVISIMILKYFITVKLELSIKKYFLILIPCSILILFAGRTKGIVFFTLFILYLIIIEYRKKISFKYVIYTAPILILVSIDRIKNTFLNSEQARSVLYKTSFKIANDYFPLGSGFSSFGSHFSRVRYSDIYYKYNIDNVWGLSPDNPSFVADAQWASILGEVGYFATVFYIISIACIFYMVLKYSKNLKEQLAISSLLIYGLLSSISDTILVSFRGISIFLIVGFFVSIQIRNEYLE